MKTDVGVARGFSPAVLVITVALLAGLQTTRAQQDSAQVEKRLASAQHKATVDGDLKGAIEEYKKIVASAGNNRAVAAQALVRMAECYEKLEVAEARNVYEQIARDYSDQKGAVAIARERLGRAPSAGTYAGMSSRRVLTLPAFGDLATGGAISSDGRILTYFDWATGGSLVVHDLATSRERRISDSRYGGSAAISRDTKQVAYNWNSNQLRVASLEGSGPLHSRLLAAIEDVLWFQIFDWSPDGTWIAVQLTRPDNTSQLGLISAGDGTLRVLKSSQWLGATQVFFSPDGKYLGFDLPAGESNTSQRDVFILAVDGTREVRAVEGSSDDTLMGWSPDGKYLLFATDRAGSVGLWAVAIVDGRPHGTPELIKPDIPRRALGVTSSGRLYTGVFLGDRDIRVASVDFEPGKLLSGPVKPVQSFVGFNDSPSWSPDGKYLAYLSRRDNLGRSRALGIQSIETGQVREWQPRQLNYFQMPRWAPDGRSVIVSGRDLKNRPGTHRVDAQTGEATRIGDRGGRPQLSPDGMRLYGDRNINGRRPIVEYDLATGNERTIIERDNLGPPGLSPDGRVIAAVASDGPASSSVLLLIPVAGGVPKELLRVTPPQWLDRRIVGWTPDGRAALVHMLDKGEQGEQGDLLLVPTAGGQPRKIDVGMRVWGGFGFDVHPDGHRIAFVGGEDKTELWVLENFLPALKASR